MKHYHGFFYAYKIKDIRSKPKDLANFIPGIVKLGEFYTVQKFTDDWWIEVHWILSSYKLSIAILRIV